MIRLDAAVGTQEEDFKTNEWIADRKVRFAEANRRHPPRPLVFQGNSFFEAQSNPGTVARAIYEQLTKVMLVCEGRGAIQLSTNTTGPGNTPFCPGPQKWLAWRSKFPSREALLGFPTARSWSTGSARWSGRSLRPTGTQSHWDQGRCPGLAPPPLTSGLDPY